MTRFLAPGLLAALATATPAVAGGDFTTGISDDRLSLPEGPGSLEGVGENVSIDANMATMRWGVPIDVPEGFAGVTPMMKLNYSSGSGSSVAGIGWTLDVPYVERMTSRGLPDYDEQDLFSVSGGDELVRISPDNEAAATPAIYRSRFERAFTRYSWVSRDGGRNGFWKGEFADGSVAFFGANKDGVLDATARVSGNNGTFRYHLVDVVDVYGHRLHYTYAKDGKQSLLARAEWVFADDGVTARYRVTLAYEDRDDHQSDGKPGFEDVLTKRLTNIAVFSKNQQIRRYALSYDDYDDASGQSRLSKVETRGVADELYPIVQSFTYSSAFGANCSDASCGQPTLVQMGTLGTSLRAGKATLIDMNGDALPDVVDTDVASSTSHRFFFNQLAANGTQSFAAPVTSQVGVSAAHPLGTRFVQVIDQNGDGFSDIVNGLTGEVLAGDGSGDWGGVRDIGIDNGFPTAAEDNELRFIDIDNDKRIDALRSDVTTTTLYRTADDGTFETSIVDSLGMSFADENVQLTDMNGDGLLDVVRARLGQISYRLALGHGTWGDQVEVDGLPISDVEDDLAQLEDMNGDGLADIVIVSGTTVKYMLNRNGERFDDAEVITSAVGGSIPERTGQTVVLAADMNGNGSTDIVWVQENGTVTFLDLFPVRAHLMTRIENGIGRVTDITYSSSVLEAAAAREGGRTWAFQVPFPMIVVKRLDETDLLSNVHDVVDYDYFDGFYDGVERVYRGYQQVELTQEGDEHQERGLTTFTYDVGDSDAHRAGLMLQEDVDGTDISGAGRELMTSTWVYEECDVAEVPTPAALEALGRKAVRRVCEVSETTIHKEGRPEAEWLTTESSHVEDGYGNTIESTELGLVGVDGDERYTTTSFVSPQNTGGRWILGAVQREHMSALPGPAIGSERVTFYDGAAFVGLAEGQLTRGDVARISERVDDAGAFDDIKRLRTNADGGVVESYDPAGVVGQHAHRASWVYDSDSINLLETATHLDDEDGQPYSLVRRVNYEDAFDKPVQATAWIRVVNGADVSPRNDMFFGYDNFGRLTSRVRPGDSAQAPTEVFRYELGSPVTRIVTERRTTAGAPDLEQVACLDGRGRTFQERSRIEDGSYQVNGFTLFNLRGDVLRSYQPYLGDSGECDLTPPEGVLATEYEFDAANRPTRVIHADGAVYATTYTPLAEVVRDAEDLDADSVAFDTPVIMRRDGLGRLTRIERTRAGGEPAALFQLRYDEENRLSGYVDPAGHVKTQRYDLRGRVLEIVDPNSGTTTFDYDAVGNVTRRTDARGVALRAAYDGANRLIERWDDADRQGTLVRARYDFDPDCDAGDCTNVAAMLASHSYPGGSERFGYDGRGNPLFVSRTLDGVAYDTRFTWDRADRSTRTVHPDGRTIDTVYDGIGRPTAVPGIIESLEYDARGLLSRLAYDNGVDEVRTYDARMRMSTLRAGSGDVLDLGYAYDRVGNVERVSDSLDVAGLSLDAENSYDEWYRVVSAALGAGADQETQSFRYDVIDNLLSATSSKATSRAQVGDYSYDAARPSAVTRAGSRTYDYDDAGQMIARADATMDWDHLGRLTSVSRGGVADGRFEYGAAETRVGKIERGGVVRYASDDFEVRDGIGVTYVRVQNARLVRLESKAISLRALTDVAPLDDEDGELNAGDAWVSHAADAGIVDAITPSPSPSGDLLLAAARRLLHDDGPQTAFLHRDLLGSAVAATGLDGDLIGRLAFHTWGETRGASGFVDVYAYTGMERDASSGLTHFAHRYLDAAVGRWASPDPAFQTLEEEDLAKFNEMATGYGYVGNNPATFVDPDGLNAAAGAAIASAAGKAASAVGKAASAVGRGASALSKGAMKLGGKISTGVKNFAKNHPKIATGIRVALLVTGAALGIAAAVMTGGAAAAVIIGMTVVSTALKVKPIATEYKMLTHANPDVRELGAISFAKGVTSSVLGLATASVGLSGVLGAAMSAKTVAGATIGMFADAGLAKYKSAEQAAQIRNAR